MDMGTIASAAVNWIYMILAGIFVFALSAGIVLVATRAKKWQQFKVIIYTKDGFGNTIIKHDRAAIFLHGKTKNRLLYLQKNKGVALKPDMIPVVKDGRNNIIHMYQDGLKQFRLLKVNIEAGNVSFDVGEEDVNWAVNEYTIAKREYAKQLWKELVPIFTTVLVSMVILIMMISLFKKFDVLAEVAHALERTSNNLAWAYNMTNMTGG